MPFSTDELFLIGERASNLRELLADASGRPDSSEAISRSRWERWRKVAGANSDERFDAVLSAMGVRPDSESEILRRLTPRRYGPRNPLPQWLATLSAICADLPAGVKRYTSTKNVPWSGKDASRLPYIHLLWPIADHARGTLKVVDPERGGLLSENAWVQLQRYLVVRLSRIVSEALHPRFLAHRALWDSGMFRLFQSSSGLSHETPVGRADYLQFVRDQGEDGLHSFWLRFPVAARLTAEVTLQWIKFVSEFLQRLREDADQLGSQFNAGQPLTQIETLGAGVSDPHDGGQSVILLTLRGGNRLVYKPRSMLIDQLFFKLVGHLNQQPGFPSLRRLQILDRGTHGWMEFVRFESCRSKAAARRFYRRAGALACVLHRLRAIDCHRENVVAAGEYPVLIDLETLEHPARFEEQSPDSEEDGWALTNSPLRTGFLPLWQPRITASGYYDDTGLGGSVSERSVEARPSWYYVNTDRMARLPKKRVTRYPHHRPRLDGRVLSVGNFAADVAGGYRQAATLLSSGLSKEFLHWQTVIRQATRRYVTTPTSVYTLILRRSLRPEVLADGVIRSIELYALPCNPGQKERWRKEVSSLEQLDIPYLRTGKGHDGAPETDIIQNQSDATDQLSLVTLAARRKLHLHEGTLHILPEQQEKLSPMR